MTAALARDVLAATNIDDAERLIDAARSILPRSTLVEYRPVPVPPVFDEDEWQFDNGFVRARVRESGAILELTTANGRNAVTQANLVAASFRRWPRHIAHDGTERADGGLDVRLRLKKSAMLMHLVLYENEPFLRVELAVEWKERWSQLRSEHWLALHEPKVEKNDRYVGASAGDGTGVAILSAAPLEWHARKLRRGGVHLASALPHVEFDLAYAPYERIPVSAIERAWDAFAHPSRVPLFEADPESVVVTQTKPRSDGNVVAVTVRECDGAGGSVRLRCAARAKTARDDAGNDIPVEDGALAFSIAPLGRRSFVVSF
jgi:hypothetical protein